MSLLDVVLGRELSVDNAEETLGKPDDVEAHDLAYHVQRCAARWVMSYRLSRANNYQIAQVRFLVVVVICIEAARTMGLSDWLAKAFFH